MRNQPIGAKREAGRSSRFERTWADLPLSSRRCRHLVVGTLALAMIGPVATASAGTPRWMEQQRVCPLVSLTTGTNYSGISGPFVGGYNMYTLGVIVRRGVNCRTANRIALTSWKTGKAGGLRWRQVAYWHTPYGGSGAAARIVGVKGKVRVDYVVVH